MRYLIKNIRYIANIFSYAFETESFSKQTRVRGITKGAAISQTKLYIYIRYLINFIRYLICFHDILFFE